MPTKKKKKNKVAASPKKTAAISADIKNSLSVKSKKRIKSTNPKASTIADIIKKVSASQKK